MHCAGRASPENDVILHKVRRDSIISSLATFLRTTADARRQSKLFVVTFDRRYLGQHQTRDIREPRSRFKCMSSSHSASDALQLRPFQRSNTRWNSHPLRTPAVCVVVIARSAFKNNSGASSESQERRRVVA